MLSRHLVIGRPLGGIPVDQASRPCLANPSLDILITQPNYRSGDLAIRRSGWIFM